MLGCDKFFNRYFRDLKLVLHKVRLSNIDRRGLFRVRVARSSSKEASEILEQIKTNNGTHNLNVRDLAKLLEDDSKNAIYFRLMYEAGQAEAFFRRKQYNFPVKVNSALLRRFAPEGVSNKVLLGLLIRTIHIPKVIEFCQLLAKAGDIYRKAVALKTIITIHRLENHSPENKALDELNQKFHEINNELTKKVKQLLGIDRCKARFFQREFREIINGNIDDINSGRVKAQNAMIDAVFIQNPPTFYQILNVVRLQEIDILRKRLEKNKKTIQNNINSSHGEQRRNLVEERNEISKRLRDARIEYRQLRSNVRRYHERVKQFLKLHKEDRYNPEQAREQRDNLLNEANDRVIEIDSFPHGLTTSHAGPGPPSESMLWDAYIIYLKIISEGTGYIARESVLNSLFRGYYPVNSDIKYNVRGIRSISTYKGHAENAYDINCDAGLQVTANLPRQVQLPERFNDNRVYKLNKIEVANKGVRTTNDLQDIFGKLAWALLNSNVSGTYGSIQSDEIREIFQNYEVNRAQPPEGFAVNPRVGAVLGGLGFYHLTVAGIPAESFDIVNELGINERRKELLQEIDEMLQGELGLQRDIFKDGIDADQGVVATSLLFREDDLRKKRGEIGSKIKNLIKENRNDIATKLWELLWDLEQITSVEPSRAAQSAQINYYYKANDDSELVIEQHVIHLGGVFVQPGERIVSNQLIGVTGVTGNARNAHNHMELHPILNGDELPPVLPHDLLLNTRHDNRIQYNLY